MNLKTLTLMFQAKTNTRPYFVEMLSLKVNNSSRSISGHMGNHPSSKERKQKYTEQYENMKTDCIKQNRLWVFTYIRCQNKHCVYKFSLSYKPIFIKILNTCPIAAPKTIAEAIQLYITLLCPLNIRSAHPINTI